METTVLRILGMFTPETTVGELVSLIKNKDIDITQLING